MEIDITDFVTSADASSFSASAAELGPDVAGMTWRNALRQAGQGALLTVPEHFAALRDWARSTGAWDASERAAWDNVECNALFIQLISGDIREAGLDDVALVDFDWAGYQERQHEGQASACLYQGDDGRIYYYLGE